MLVRSPLLTGAAAFSILYMSILVPGFDDLFDHLALHFTRSWFSGSASPSVALLAMALPLGCGHGLMFATR